jgi:hypothetical protein
MTIEDRLSVDPQPVGPSRGRSATSVVLPIIAVTAVVAFALVGAPEPLPADADPSATTNYATSTADPSARIALPEPSPGRVIAPQEVAFPNRAIGLPVGTSAEAVASLRRGDAGDGLIAVRGWLTVSPSQSTCAAATDPAIAWDGLCWRDALLSDGPAEVLAPRTKAIAWVGEPGVRLHIVVLPGASLEGLAVEPFSTVAAALAPVPVVIVGRFGDPRLFGDCGVRRHCRDRFVLERLMWADGRWIERVQVRDPNVPPDAGSPLSRMIFQDSLRDAGFVLSEALVPVADLGTLDADAAAATPDSVAGPVWYMRVVVRRPWRVPDVTQRVHWLVVDHPSGRIVAVSDSLDELTLRPRDAAP